MAINIFQEVAKDLGSTKIELSKLRVAFERRDDFINWLVEIKYGGVDYLSDLWDEFEKYEDSHDEPDDFNQ